MKSRLVASIALGALVLLGATGCSMISPQATTIPYSPADGVNIPDSGPLQVRNAMLVADESGADGNFVAAIINSTSESHTLSLEFGEGDGAIAKTVRVPANTVLSLGTEDTDPLLVEGIDTMPGADIPVFFQSGDGETVRAAVPVLDGTLPYLAPLVP
ncbi:DNA modification methylase [Microbacterium sp. RU33B]|uniref:DNA modification methylase n=1 Tax=Microbacterium sp. RU33B TaxID=1907390 RepID=UPI00095E987C|nr:DNA modification methylase [Microbacterium sp. RU33B]SIT69911.1 hypothetical protein SAMN05880545_0605 [Microbacterium sp. RU33B]